jgi:hypothetical protein
MKLIESLASRLALLGIVALQVSCGDSSGPGSSAATIAANSSTTITAAPGADVAELPSVILRDQSGSPVGGVPVTFAVTGGGGTVTGDHTTTNPSGIATVGSWTLGPNTGTNTLVATAGGLSVTFTASTSDPCSATPAHAIGSTTNGQLSLTDCQLSDGSFVDFYAVTIPTAGTYLFSQASTAFDTYIAMLSSTGVLLGVNDDAGTSTTNSVLKVLVPPGNFIIGANSYDANVTGAYTLTSGPTTAEVTNCEDAFVLRGITSAQSLQASDCNINGFYGDEYVILLAAGQSITISMNSTVVDSYLEVHSGNSATILASNDDVNSSTKNAQLVFTPTTSDFYVIAARSTSAGVIGAYTLGVQ